MFTLLKVSFSAQQVKICGLKHKLTYEFLNSNSDKMLSLLHSQKNKRHIKQNPP